MIRRIDLKHFKCFHRLQLPLSPLTLLSGANASGKTSVLQAFVLLHQTMREHEWSRRLILNGGTVRLGTVADVVDQHARRSCELALREGEREYRWEFAGEPEEMSMAVTRVWLGQRKYENPAMLRHLLPWSGVADVSLSVPAGLNGLSYLTAERIGPRDTYPLDTYPIEDGRFKSVVGPRGEHAVSVLHAGRDEYVPDRLAIDGVPPTRLRQTEAHMRRFFPGFEMDLQKVPQANAVMLGLRTSNDVAFHRPINTGFGLTQVLPIVVAALSASPNDLTLVENPEVHLHPLGQAEMGLFLSEVAAAGVQVILETHSDHVLNGIRRAVKQGILRAEAAALHFFAPRPSVERDGIAQVQTPLLDARGSIDSWPDGFFDQFDKDLNYFAGWS